MSYAKSLLDGVHTGAHMSPSQADCERSAGRLRPMGGAGRVCPVVWDGWLCWPPTLGGATIKQPCPDIHNFNTQQFAYRSCLSNGTWYGRHGSGGGWSNYSLCVLSSPTARPAILPLVTSAGYDAVKDGGGQQSLFGLGLSSSTVHSTQTSAVTQLFREGPRSDVPYPLDDVIGSGVHAVSAVCLLLALVTWVTLKLTDRLVTKRYLVLVATIVTSFLFHIIVLTSRMRAVALGVATPHPNPPHHHLPPQPSPLQGYPPPFPPSHPPPPHSSLLRQRSEQPPPASAQYRKRQLSSSLQKRAPRHVNAVQSFNSLLVDPNKFPRQFVRFRGGRRNNEVMADLFRRRRRRRTTRDADVFAEFHLDKTERSWFDSPITGADVFANSGDKTARTLLDSPRAGANRFANPGKKTEMTSFGSSRTGANVFASSRKKTEVTLLDNSRTGANVFASSRKKTEVTLLDNSRTGTNVFAASRRKTVRRSLDRPRTGADDVMASPPQVRPGSGFALDKISSDREELARSPFVANAGMTPPDWKDLEDLAASRARQKREVEKKNQSGKKGKKNKKGKGRSRKKKKKEEDKDEPVGQQLQFEGVESDGGSWVTLCQVGRAFYLLTDLCVYAFLFSTSLYYTLIVLGKDLTFNRLVIMFVFGVGVPVTFVVFTILLYSFLPIQAPFGSSCTVDALGDEFHWATTAPKLICIVLALCLMTVSTYGFWRLHVPALHASSETFYARQGVLKCLTLLLACSLAELFFLVTEYQKMYGMVTSPYVVQASTSVLGVKGCVLAFLFCFLDSEVLHGTCCAPPASDGEPWLRSAPVSGIEGTGAGMGMGTTGPENASEDNRRKFVPASSSSSCGFADKGRQPHHVVTGSLGVGEKV